MLCRVFTKKKGGISKARLKRREQAHTNTKEERSCGEIKKKKKKKKKKTLLRIPNAGYLRIPIFSLGVDL
jgi:hypothetical protein